jgi:hypothetical protein
LRASRDGQQKRAHHTIRTGIPDIFGELKQCVTWVHAESRVVALRIGAGLSAAVAMIACPKPAEAARVPWSISVQVATASTLAIDADPDVRPNNLGNP